jgi:hypothetical protein
MSTQTSIPVRAESPPGGPKSSSSRIPAVIGVDPWSWRGDDNSGNMIHAAAARRMLSSYVEYKRPGEWTDADIDRLRSEHSHIVYVTANLIRLGVPGDHPSIERLIASQAILAKNIERAGLPVVVFGLGSQASLNGPNELSVAPQTVRLLKVLSDHSRKIAVRGEFTAAACVKLGVGNVEVVGCQSIFWHRSPQFNWKMAEPAGDGAGEIACNFTDASLEANLIRQAMAGGHDVIGQSNGDEEDLRQQAGLGPTTGIKFGWDVEIAIQKGLIDRQQYTNWVRHHFYQFRRPQPWLDHMRRYCFSYGTRLHGNIAAMLAGVRAIWIVHDMRLKEVLDHFQLPRIELKEAQNGVSLKALSDKADYSECAKVYPDRYRTLFDYVDGAGLPHSLPAPADEARPLRGSAPAQRKTPAFA